MNAVTQSRVVVFVRTKWGEVRPRRILSIAELDEMIRHPKPGDAIVTCIETTFVSGWIPLVGQVTYWSSFSVLHRVPLATKPVLPDGLSRQRIELALEFARQHAA